VELGLFVGLAMSIKSDLISKYCVNRSLSLSWFLGKALCTARAFKSDVVDALVRMIRSEIVLVFDSCRYLLSRGGVDYTPGKSSTCREK
jgi:hypothetical protein